MNQLTHCQICARDIKANTGLIAHHGYQRPGYGWQSASCDGAKQLPYEVSRDFIPVVIARYKLYEQMRNDAADEMLRSPAEQIVRSYKNLYSGETTTETFDKPADFDAYDTVNNGYSYYDDYAKEFSKQYTTYRKEAKDIASTIEYLQNRYDSWKAK